MVHQSRHAQQRSEPVNGDGFGLGWYPVHSDPEPGMFKSIEPAWNNENLLSISSKIQTSLFFAHVRDASPDLPVTRTNCHPFRWGNFMWMHNGWLEDFYLMKQTIAGALSQKAYLTIQGNTDSEYAFALFLDEIQFRQDASQEQMNQALFEVISKICWYRIKLGIESNAQMNFAVSNGKTTTVTRFSSLVKEKPASLFYFQGKILGSSKRTWFSPPDISKNSTSNQSNLPTIIASEPLSSCPDCWKKMERNTYISVSAEQTMTIAPIPIIDA
nr:class II glutamine amidotransferase [Aliikangiella sp. G2MR2-5]